MLKALEPISVASGWDDARAAALEKFSIAYFNILDDGNLALQLIIEGRALARDPELKDRFDRDWQTRSATRCCAQRALH